MKYVEKKLFPFANGYMNRLTYLYQNVAYWAMSPFYFGATDTGAYEFNQYSTGAAGHAWVTATWLGLRPVISLKSDVEISGGVGTSDNPYIVKTA